MKVGGGQGLTESSEKVALDRTVFFSDSVMAIAITLLAFDIKAPELAHGHSSGALAQALWDLWPRYLSHTMSFLVIGSYWWIHHQAFRVMRRHDDALIWLNLLFLLCVAFIPFATTVLGEHRGEPVAATFYAVCVASAGLMEAALWSFAAHNHRLIDAHVPLHAIRGTTFRALSAPVVFLASVPIIWVNTYVGMVCWALAPVLIAAFRNKSPSE